MKRQGYEIRFEGHLAADWSEWFGGLAVRRESNGDTTLSGPLDQAALQGVLAKIRDLGLTLVAVNLRNPHGPSVKRRIETKVSRTAMMTCLCRAVSSLEKDRCYRSDDRVALSLMPGFLAFLIHIPFFGRLLPKAFTAKGIYELVIARTKYFDAVFRQAFSDRFSQILLVGAGFDTRALRFQEEARDTRIFEMDAPLTLEAKESLPMKLEQAGFRRNEKSLFVMEGVLEYLRPESVDRTFRTIRDWAGKGSEVLFNYVLASVIRRECTCYGEEGGLETLDKTGESWHFGIEAGEIGRFLSKYGFELREHRDARELEEMYFKDPSGRIVGRVNGMHCLARAVKIRS